MAFRFRKGQRFVYQNQIWEIETFTAPQKVRIIATESGECAHKDISELTEALGAGKLYALVEGGGIGKPKIRTNYLKADLSMLPEKMQNIVRKKAQYVEAIQKAKLPCLTEATMAPIIKDVAGQIGDKKPPYWTSAWRWVRKIQKSEDVRALIPSNWYKGNYIRQRTYEVYNIMDEAIESHYLTRERPSIVSTLDVINKAIDDNNELRDGLNKLKHISYKTLQKKIAALDPYIVARERHGQPFADQLYKLCEQAPQPTRILERVEFDHTKLDIFVVDEDLGIVYGRPWLTIALDAFSRCILGFFVSFEPPSALSVLACLEHAVWPKTYIKDRYPDIRYDWPAAGIPEVCAYDNGKDFVGTNVEDACRCLGSSIDFCPVQKPWYKGKIERFFRTLNTKIIHELPGTSFSNVMDKGDYDPKKNAVVTYEMLDWLLHKWIVEVYHQERHKGIGMTPALMWQKGEKDFEPRFPSSKDELTTLLGYTDERSIGREGIELFCLHYSSPALAKLRSYKTESGKFKIKYSPRDLGQIQVFDPSPAVSDWITVPAVDQEYAARISIWQHNIFRRYARQEYGDTNIKNLRKSKSEIKEAVLRCCQKLKKTTMAQKIARFVQLGFDLTMTQRVLEEPERKMPTSKSSIEKPVLPKVKDHPTKGIADVSDNSGAAVSPKYNENNEDVVPVELVSLDEGDELELDGSFTVAKAV